MNKRLRLILFLSVLLFISGGAYLVIRYAQGYRFNPQNGDLTSTGLLVTKSVPDSAQVWVDGKLKTATDATINLPPGTYNVEIKKDGFSTWQKQLTIKKELVTSADAHLFSTYPGLKALTYTGAINPVLSPDGQRVVFGVATDSASLNSKSAWVLELSDRPLGLSREPRQIIKNNVAGRDFSQGKYTWSPDSKQVLITLSEKPLTGKSTVTRNFLVDADKVTPENQLVDLGSELTLLLDRWQEEENLEKQAQAAKLPEKLLQAIEGKVDHINFSPDESKIYYTATASASIPEEIIPPLPSANDQPESRQIEANKVYVYDFKEDRNFYVCEAPKSSPAAPTFVSWFPTSRHLFLVQEDKAYITEYDGTNKMIVYSGDFQDSFAAPFPDSNRILVLTSIGKDSPLNLYAVWIR